MTLVEPKSNQLTQLPLSIQEIAAEQQAARQKPGLSTTLDNDSIAIRIILLCSAGAWNIWAGISTPFCYLSHPLVGSAAVKMIASGELWNIFPELIVLFAALGLATVFGIALGDHGALLGG